MKSIIQYLKKQEVFDKWVQQTHQLSSQLLLGLSGSAKHMVAAMLLEEYTKPIVLVTPTLLQATHAYDELVSWYPDDVFLFSAEESLAAEMSYVSPEIRSERIEVLTRLLNKQRGIYIMPMAALRKPLAPTEIFSHYVKVFRMGEEITVLEELARDLGDMGYRFEKMVTAPGEFSIRGSIIDIYPLTMEHPIRIDLFDVEIDSIRTFDAQTQRSLEVVETVVIPPAHEVPVSLETITAKSSKIEQLFDKAIQEAIGEHQELLVANKAQFLTQVEAGEMPQELGIWTTVLYERTNLLDYVPGESYLLVDDYARISEQERQLVEEDAVWITGKMERGQLPASVVISLDGKQVLKDSKHAKTYLAMMHKGMGRMKFEAVETIDYRGMTQFFSQMPLVKSESDRWAKQHATTFVVVNDMSRAKKVEQTFHDFQVEAIVSTDEIVEHRLQIIVGSLQSGFELPKLKINFVNERELFNKITKKAPRSQKMSNAERLKSYTELNVGDYVVHVNHGIGIYKGMETLEIAGVHQDYMSIHYQDGGHLFVPVTQIKLVQKYVSSDAKEPKLNKLGGSDWAKTKRKVVTKIEDIADELIELYAKRDSEKGFAFEVDTAEQAQFESEFPYTETEDQLRSIVEIKKDMEKEKPMDRLLVGDVGYGKTEVAMRAVFKAVMNGKQAAILVPTTILAEQHYENFMRRFDGYPIKIGMLSRFRTKQQQEETITQLRKGEVDIVIGTHRVLSKDVQFFDLGLLVVDEEQRFGVKHKERLKQLKSQVDVLTLTATPIPRTLHMSMLGVRDLSVIETPPANRYPVQTYVMEKDMLTVRDAIEREMARGGQAFYLYNRVETIEQKAEEIRRLVPDVRVAIAHGQMSETSLENILYQFVEGEYDVLVTTTIIETGVDIPNVNTLMVEHADKMGLSQLYQLRGRVGRTNRVAYAYLMYEPQKLLSEASEKRLQAMREFTDLGSGFKIAMRDLSIRGAGNLLGKQQHGFIDSVGFDLYSQMLSDAVAVKQGKKVPEKEDTVEIDVGIDAYIPASYIQDERQKIEFYKRIRSIETVEDKQEILDDLMDRYGDFPDAVADLVEIGMIKSYAEQAGVVSIKRVRDAIVVTFNKDRSKQLKGMAIFEVLAVSTLKAQINVEQEQLKVSLAIHGIESYRILDEIEKIIQESREKV